MEGSGEAPKYPIVVIQGKFLDGPWKGQTKVHMKFDLFNHKGAALYSFPDAITSSSFIPPNKWPNLLVPVTENLLNKVNVSGLYDPDPAIDEYTKQHQEYYMVRYIMKGSFSSCSPMHKRLPTSNIVMTGVYKLCFAPPTFEKPVKELSTHDSIAHHTEPTSATHHFKKNFADVDELIASDAIDEWEEPPTDDEQLPTYAEKLLTAKEATMEAIMKSIKKGHDESLPF